MTDVPGPDPAPEGEPLAEREAPQQRRHGAAEPGPALQAHLRAAQVHVAHARAEFEEANARIQQRTGRNLLLAIVIGLAIGAAVLASLVFFKWIFLVFAVAAASLAIFELTRALQAAGRKVDLIPQLACGALLMLSGYFSQVWLHWVATFVAVAIVVVWRLLGQMAVRDGRTYGAVFSDAVTAVFVQLYVPFLASLAMILLAQPGGEWWILAFLIVTVVADTGAYVTGLTLGRHPMAPRISPKKTWEGFIGATVVALAAGVLLAIYMLGLPWWAGLIFGAAVLGTATAGDLAESMLKRDLGIKDMSSWLPGHGGVLDRLDSILPSATAALALYYFLTPLAVS